ncbi:uncharacterized protein V1516DRAFT_682361 [Lipomyces oligophaga]|uniref:uncharacterized protein n=1 Tax=Lipomyces oligophaga TaxID=45792 RepID=UPI0034CEB0A1
MSWTHGLPHHHRHLWEFSEKEGTNGDEEEKLPIYIAPPAPLPAHDSAEEQMKRLQEQVMADMGLSAPPVDNNHEEIAPDMFDLYTPSRASLISSLEGPGSNEMDDGISASASGKKVHMNVQLRSMNVPPSVDSYYIPQYVVPEIISENIYRQLMLNEVHWGTLMHRGGPAPRLVAVQAEINDGWYPIYRHPMDPPNVPTYKFSASVKFVKATLESAIGQSFNHVLIQQYRSGDDGISEHADKTLDIVPGSKIVNVSFGAQRNMLFKKKRNAWHQKIEYSDDDERNSEDEYEPSKVSSETNTGDAVSQVGCGIIPLSHHHLPHHKHHQHHGNPLDSPSDSRTGKPAEDTPINVSNHPPRPNQRVTLQNNSVLVLGLETNKLWTHGIKPDRRSQSDRSSTEKAFGGIRISLTFRNIGTFVGPFDESSGTGSSPTQIYGQGSTAKSKLKSAKVLYANEANDHESQEARLQAKKLLVAFAAENRLGTDFDWERAYGKGYDIVEFPKDDGQ